MSKLNNLLRKPYNYYNSLKLKNKNFSLLSSNCTGSLICQDLHLRSNSPFVNLWLYPKDFIKYCNNLSKYSSADIKFIKKPGINYPVGLINDIEIYFQHYSSEEQARFKWNERSKRINKDNLYILMSDRDGCTDEDLNEFDKLPYSNKVVLTSKKHENIKSCFQIKGFENDEFIGLIYTFKNAYTWKKWFDYFPYIKWFNGTLDIDGR